MPMELHVVHFKEEYETLESALRRPNGVTILVYFCKVKNLLFIFISETYKNDLLLFTLRSDTKIYNTQKIYSYIVIMRWFLVAG